MVMVLRVPTLVILAIAPEFWTLEMVAPATELVIVPMVPVLLIPLFPPLIVPELAMALMTPVL